MTLLLQADRDAAASLIGTSTRIIGGAQAALAQRFLEFSYRNYVYGHWRQGLRWVNRQHRVAIAFHEACKALFCPICTRCNRHHMHDECIDPKGHDICWRPVGTAPVREEAGGEGEGAIRECPLHGKLPWRTAMVYTTVAMFTGNKAAKTSIAAAEIYSWSLGYRPWDDTLTAPIGQGRIWMIVCQTLATSGRTTIEPLINRYGGNAIKPNYTSSRTLSGWTVRKGPTAGDIIKLVSHDQHERSASVVSPIAGVNPAGILWDEPTEAEIRTEATRGLAPAMSELNWGRELMSATLIEGAADARAYMRNEVWDPAGNRGGASKEIFVLGGSIYDNPALTRETIRQIIAKWAPWERAARISGIEGVDSGRLLPDFDTNVHVWDDAQYDPLLLRGTREPSEGAVFMAVDPHDIRPWVMVWVLIEEGGLWRVIREWPTQPFREMRHYRVAETDSDCFGGHFEDYARIIAEVEAGIPGGAGRVIRRIMDPAFGDSEKAGSGQTVRKAMQEQGYYFETDFPRDIEPGHHLLRKLIRGSWEPGKLPDALHFPHMLVARCCQNVIWAALNYVNDPGKNPASSREKPGEAGKDHIDCLRYLATSRCDYVNWKTIGKNFEAAKARVAARRRITRW